MSEQRDLRADLREWNSDLINGIRSTDWFYLAGEYIERAIDAEEELEKQQQLFEAQTDRNVEIIKRLNERKREVCEANAALREENELQRHSIQQLSAQVAGLQAVAEAANLILFWRGISETDDKKASDDWVKFLQDNGYWDRYDGCCNCSLCTKAREEYKKSVEKRLYEAVKAYREISQPDPGAEIIERIKKLEAVAEAARGIKEYLSNNDNCKCAWCGISKTLRQALAALEGDSEGK